MLTNDNSKAKHDKLGFLIVYVTFGVLSYLHLQCPQLALQCEIHSTLKVVIIIIIIIIIIINTLQSL